MLLPIRIVSCTRSGCRRSSSNSNRACLGAAFSIVGCGRRTDADFGRRRSRTGIVQLQLSSNDNNNNNRGNTNKVVFQNSIIGRPQRQRQTFIRALTSSSTTTSTTTPLIDDDVHNGDGNDDDDNEVVPLIFLHGMKGSHLAFYPIETETTKNDDDDDNNNNKKENEKEKGKEKQRSWLTLGGILNIPRQDETHPGGERDISLPLTYQNNTNNTNTNNKEYPIQDRGKHFVDGTVDHIVQLSTLLPTTLFPSSLLLTNKIKTMIPGGDTAMTSNSNPMSNNKFDFFPFYGHVTKLLEEMNDAYICKIKSATTTTTTTASTSTRPTRTRTSINDDDNDSSTNTKTNTNTVHTDVPYAAARPTRSFVYDWRRNLFEITEDFYDYCLQEYPHPETKIQLVAHSLGGLIAYAAMKKYPEKFAPGAVLVGVPFGTGIQYFQDVHKGYFTELGTCRQFLPPSQFTFSSHWSFFPTTSHEQEESFVDVTDELDNNNNDIEFVADRSTIGKKNTPNKKNTTSSSSLLLEQQRPAVPGTRIAIDFYNPEEWEKHQIGIFDPTYKNQLMELDTTIEKQQQDELEDTNSSSSSSSSSSTRSSNIIEQYKQHMKLQMDDAKRWRATVLAPIVPFDDDNNDDDENRMLMPPLIICSTNTVPTVNQILRRRKRHNTPPTTRTASMMNTIVQEYFPRSMISLLEQKEQQNQQQINQEHNKKKGNNETTTNDADNNDEKKKNSAQQHTSIDDATSTVCPPQQQQQQWEYDYGSGRTVPGDGRIDYDKSFPPTGIPYQVIELKSVHAKQFCWAATSASDTTNETTEDTETGSLHTIMKQVQDQLHGYYQL